MKNIFEYLSLYVYKNVFYNFLKNKKGIPKTKKTTKKGYQKQKRDTKNIFFIFV